MHDIVGCDREGAIHRRHEGADGDQEVVRREHQPARASTAPPTRPCAARTSSSGLSGPGAVSVDAVKTMATDAIVFAMANPSPRCTPEEIEGHVARDRHRPLRLPQPDQQRARVPGHLPRGALDAPRPSINEAMKLAAARAIAVGRSPRTRCTRSTSSRACSTAPWSSSVAAAVAEAAVETGVAQRSVEPPTDPSAIYR